MSHLTSLIPFEVERGCRNVFCRSMRFSNFLFFRFSRWYSQSNHIPGWRFCGKEKYSIRSMKNQTKFLNKVSVFMGYDCIEDFFEQEGIQGKSGVDGNDLVKEVDVELSCARFPCVTLGNSPLVELYDEALCQPIRMNLLLSESCSGSYLPCSKNMTEPEDSDGWSSLESSLSDVASFSSKMNCHMVSCTSEPHFLDAEKVEPSAKESSSTYKESGISAATGSILDKPIKVLEGISRRHCHQLENSGFHTVRKLLHHFPRTYADLQNSEDSISDGQYAIFVGTVLSSRGVKAGISFSFLEVVVACDSSSSKDNPQIKSKEDCREERTVYLHLKKYFRGTRFTNQFFLRSVQSKYKEGDHAYVSGKVKKLQAENHYEMREYCIDILDDEEKVHASIERRPYPLYPSKAGLKPGFLRDIISSALKLVPSDIDPIPVEVLNEFNLLNLRDAYIGIHHPRDLHVADSARRRLIFDDFFYIQLGRLFQMLDALGTQIEKEGLLDRYRKEGLNSVSIDGWSVLARKFLEALPYSLTPSQLNAASEIIWDLKRPVPMNRLLQGDVGCGKTVVAFLACMEVIGSGFQAAFMVPTELLAAQHYEYLLSLLENIEGHNKPSVAILTGSTSLKQSRIIRQGLRSGDIDLVIGTHSLIAEKVEFSALRIAVVDEQQRFGVIQRGRFNSKLYNAPEVMKMSATTSNGSSDKLLMAPHVLAMSATPIPRTLALALYGDMTLTQITDLPPGRMPVTTHVLQGDDHGFGKVYQMMHDELLAAGKVYLVYPVIEESEQLPQLHAAAADYECISSKFQGFQCGLLHGRMKSDEKEHALQQFRSGETRILLSTQVIEIGVDVPDASMMVVMNAERFGIAQLHQLRGRVGRGEKKSKCVLLASTAGALGRLKVLERSSDGFYLANADLLLRGPGNLLGKKQSGHLPEFPIARLEIDGNILQDAHFAALKVLGASSDLQDFPNLKAELSMRQPLCPLGD